MSAGVQLRHTLFVMSKLPLQKDVTVWQCMAVYHGVMRPISMSVLSGCRFVTKLNVIQLILAASFAQWCLVAFSQLHV